MPQPVNPGFYDPSWKEWDEKDNKWGRRGVIALLVVAVLFAGVLLFKPVIKKAFRSGGTTTTTLKFDTKAVVYAVNDSTGTAASIPVNNAQTGYQAGTVPMTLTAGNYSADVTGNGKWTVTFSFPGNTGIVSLPFVKTLSGPEVVGPFSGSQDVTVTYGAFVAPSAPVTIHVMDLQGTVASQVLTTSTSGVQTAQLRAQGNSFYLVTDNAPRTWFLRVVLNGGT